MPLTSRDPLRHVIGPLTRPELDDPEIRPALSVERILFYDGLDLWPALPYCQNDAAVSWNFPSGDEEIAGGIMSLEEDDVRGHVPVDLVEVGLVGQFDQEHMVRKLVRMRDSTSAVCPEPGYNPALR